MSMGCGWMEEIAEAIVEFDEEKAKAAAKGLMNQPAGVHAIVEGVREGLERVGRKYEEKGFFLSDLIMAAALAEELFGMIRPAIECDGVKAKGRVLIGTVESSVHSMGKSIVVSILRSAGYEVLDLGANVFPETFLEKTKQFKPQVVGVSVGLTQALPSVRRIVEALESAGLRRDVKIILGGNAANEQRAREMGVDAYASTSVAGLQIIDSWFATQDEQEKI